jgi:hypothetical protein
MATTYLTTVMWPESAPLGWRTAHGSCTINADQVNGDLLVFFKA